MPIKKASEKKTSVKDSGEEKLEFKICPYCGNEIRLKAIKCQYCGEWFQKKSTTRSGGKNRETRRFTAKEIDHKGNSFVRFITGTELNRIGRAKYVARSVVFELLITVCVLFAGGIMSAIVDSDASDMMSILRALIVLVVFVPTLYGGIVLNNKRLHDWGWSGWTQLFLLVPIVNFVLGICMWVIPGNKGENEYGEHCNSKTREKIVSIIYIPLLILIPALMPRMQSAQGRARDVSRKTALSQIQSAIVTYQSDYGKWPGMYRAKNGISVSEIQSELISAGMSIIPSDPLSTNDNSGLGYATSQGEYLYMVSKRNGVDNKGFILMAKTEVPGGSNWVVCNDGKGKINPGTDLLDITPCDTVVEGDYCRNSNGRCTYSSEDELRYIIIF